jgi:hypothetical protein
MALRPGLTTGLPFRGSFNEFEEMTILPFRLDNLKPMSWNFRRVKKFVENTPFAYSEFRCTIDGVDSPAL